MDAFENIKMAFNCPKKLDELQPCGQNWSCASCEKMVFDFRGMSETDIMDIFMRSGQKLCGIYEADRFATLPPRTHWQKWLSAGMVALGLSGLTQIAFAQQGFTMGKIKMPAKKDTVETQSRTVTVGVVSAPVFAEFNGGDEALQVYLRKHVANKENFKGRIIATFTVEKDGSVSNVAFMKTGGIVLDGEIKNALQNSPKWRPVQANGEPIASKYIVDINLGTNGIEISR